MSSRAKRDMINSVHVERALVPEEVVMAPGATR